MMINEGKSENSQSNQQVRSTMEVIQMPKKTKGAKTKKVQVKVRDIKPAKDAKGGAYGKVWVR